MDKSNFSKKFLELKPNYERLGLNIQQALETFLKENKIHYLSIQYRVKELDSFLEKIDRKNYENPFDEIEDICGIRIICYYQSDIKKIQDIIFKELEVTESQTKEDLLDASEFGYRSTHFIAKIKNDWCTAPNYRGLNTLKCEIQVRTILMHSWAEIEHKLSYKSEKDIPKELRRKFSFISAILEDADVKFEDIRNSIEKNKSQLIENAKKNKKFNENTELNLDTLQAFLDFAFPSRKKNIEDTSRVLDSMIEFNIPFSELIMSFSKNKDTILQIENEINKKPEISNNVTISQTGAARTLLDLTNDNFFSARENRNIHSDIVKKFRNKIKE